MSVSYGWLDPGPDTDERVGLVVQAAYHLDEFLPLRDELRRRGVLADLLVPRPPEKPLNHFRPGVRRFRELLDATPLALDGYSDGGDIVGQLSSVVVMNDWGLPKPLVESVRASRRPAFAWVEGVQDFADVDTDQNRRPYRHVDHVFCLGQYGADQLDTMSRSIVGSARLRALWARPVAAASIATRVTVSSNFTYGVLIDSRRRWLASAAKACSAAGVPWVLSRHTAERGWSFPHRVSDLPIGDLLEASTHFVGRFSTVGYEALVRGVEFIYHNPHGEKEPTFTEPRGAFVRTSTTAELRAALVRPARPAHDVRSDAEEFLAYHLRLDGDRSPAELAADVIIASIR